MRRGEGVPEEKQWLLKNDPECEHLDSSCISLVKIQAHVHNINEKD